MGESTIARSLALVAIGTGLAFVHWSFNELKTELGDPEPVTDTDGPAAADSQGEAPDPDDTTADPGSENSGDAASEPFDPNTLGRDIGTPDTYQLWETGLVTFVDARPEDEYLAGHIPLAVHVPPESLDQGRLGDLVEMTGIGPGDRVVIYCEGGSCDASHLVGLRLADMGFTRIHIDIDGYPGWVDAGYEIEEGPDVILGDLP
jgi:rhodanese-related sulfurtransferase